MRCLALSVVILLVAGPACGKRHGKQDGNTGEAGAACTVDTQCLAAKCCDNVCVETNDCAFAVTTATPAVGFVDGGDYIELSGAGFVPGMKVFLGDGRAPVRVTSPTTALILTPPDQAGLEDIKIVVGAQTAILHKAFTYRVAGLETEWEQKPLQVVRGEDPGLAVMRDGRVLIAGGTTIPDNNASALDTAEIYQRDTDTVAPAANKMSTVRWHDSAVPLLTGKVLIVGATCNGGGCAGDGTLADLFDPATNMFAPTANKLSRPRHYTRSVLLPDGRVFIASMNDPSVEIYDPDTDQFTLIDHAPLHTYGFVVRLRDGRVLLAGGDGGNTAAELFDPETNTFAATTGPLVAGRSMLTAHTLPSGKVMVIAGASSSAGAIVDPLASIELFDPATAMFSMAPYQLVTPRTWHASALVRDGTVLVMGGYTVSTQCGSSVATVEQIDPVLATVKPFSTLPNTNAEWTAVTLLDGSVLGVGGGACGTSMALPDIDFLKGAPIQ